MTRTITIEPVLNGFLVQVGCQRVVFKSIEELSDALRAYYRDPKTVEKSFIINKVNDTMEDAPRVAPPRGPVLQNRIDSEVNRPYTTEQCGTVAPQCEPPRGAPLR